MRLHPAGFRSAYPPRWVNSLYFDTYQLNALTDNLAGLASRSKLRLRWYGSVSPVREPIIELKQKESLVGWKRQLPLRCELDLIQPWHNLLPRIRDCLPQVWKSRFQAAAQPVLLNRYWRAYYISADGAVRVTLDSRQSVYEQRLAARPNLRAALPTEDVVVVEIKADQSHADQVQAVADAFPIPRTRNSKYAKGMLTALYTR